MNILKRGLIVGKRRRIALVFLGAALLAISNIQVAKPAHKKAASMPRLATALEKPTDGPGADTMLTYISGSSVKLEQIIGDCDWAVKAATGACQRTASQTITNANVAGNGLGYSFEQPDNGRLVFLFGDTVSNDPSQPWSTSNVPFVRFLAQDPVGWTTTSDPEAGLLLNFFPSGNTPLQPLFVSPVFPDGTKVDMGPDNVPDSGIDFNGKTYLICNTGVDTNASDPFQGAFSLLVTWNTATNTFSAGRTISQGAAGGHFIVTAVHSLLAHQAGAAGMQGILMYGLGAYRASDVYLSFTPAPADTPAGAGAPLLESGGATMYFTGLTNGQPTWSDKESDAAPVVKDVVDGPTIGNVSVTYSPDLGLWLMTFDGGRPRQEATGDPTTGTEATEGDYFCYAPAPWGPWSSPQLIFNAARDNGYGVFIHNSNDDPVGPDGPTIGTNDPTTTRGGIFAPEMIERFTTVEGKTLKLYYTISTWNPYTVVKMRSQFAITVAPDFSLGFAPPTANASVGSKAPVTVDVNRIGGFTGNVTLGAPAMPPQGIRFPGLPAATTGNSLAFKIKIKGSAQPGTYNLVFPGKDDSGRERDALLTLVLQ